MKAITVKDAHGNVETREVLETESHMGDTFARVSETEWVKVE